MNNSKVSRSKYNKGAFANVIKDMCKMNDEDRAKFIQMMTDEADKKRKSLKEAKELHQKVAAENLQNRIDLDELFKALEEFGIGKHMFSLAPLSKEDSVRTEKMYFLDTDLPEPYFLRNSFGINSLTITRFTSKAETCPNAVSVSINVLPCYSIGATEAIMGYFKNTIMAMYKNMDFGNKYNDGRDFEDKIAEAARNRDRFFKEHFETSLSRYRKEGEKSIKGGRMYKFEDLKNVEFYTVADVVEFLRERKRNVEAYKKILVKLYDHADKTYQYIDDLFRQFKVINENIMSKLRENSDVVYYLNQKIDLINEGQDVWLNHKQENIKQKNDANRKMLRNAFDAYEMEE